MNRGNLILRNQSHFCLLRDLLNQHSEVLLESVQCITALFGLNPADS